MPGQRRAEASGDAFTLMIAEDANHVFAIERFINQKIARVKLENFDYRYTALFEQDKPGAKSGYGFGQRGLTKSRQVLEPNRPELGA